MHQQPLPSRIPSMMRFSGLSQQQPCQIIEIESSQDCFSDYAQQIPMPSFRASLPNNTGGTRKPTQKRKTNSHYNITINNNFQGDIFCQPQPDHIEVMNCPQAFPSLASTISKETSSSGSEFNQSTCLPEKDDNLLVSRKKMNKCHVLKMRRKNLFKKKTIQAIEEFQEQWDGQSLQTQLRKDLWKPPQYIRKHECEQAQPQPQSLRRNASDSIIDQPLLFSKKLTRNHFKRIKPYLDLNQDDKDLQDELVRLEKGRYRYDDHRIASKINTLTKKIPELEKEMENQPIKAIVPELPAFPLNSDRHHMLVDMLRRQFLKRVTSIVVE